MTTILLHWLSFNGKCGRNCYTLQALNANYVGDIFSLQMLERWQARKCYCTLP
jgi:hypothetical protein